MKTRLHVLYIPGLGDTRVDGQRLAAGTWRLWGVAPEVVHMRWADQSEDWDTKRARLLSRIDELTASEKAVGLVGSSAGAAAVITAFALRSSQIAGCVLIAGKVNHPETIGERIRVENPAFYDAAQECEKAIPTLSVQDRTRIMSRYALHDGVVPQRDSFIAGAHNRAVSTIGHPFTIGTQLLFGAPLFLRFLKHNMPLRRTDSSFYNQ